MERLLSIQIETFAHWFEKVDMATLDGCQSLVSIMWDLESAMFEVTVKEWVAIVSWVYLPAYNYLLLAFWASHIYYSFFLFYHLIYLLFGLGPCSACMLWLNTSWVLDLTNIFSSYLSLFSVIFSHWHYHYTFSLHHTSSLVMFIFFSFSSSLPTWHCLCFTLSGGFSHYYMEDNNICSLFHFIGNGLEI